MKKFLALALLLALPALAMDRATYIEAKRDQVRVNLAAEGKEMSSEAAEAWAKRVALAKACDTGQIDCNEALRLDFQVIRDGAKDAPDKARYYREMGSAMTPAEQ